MRSRSMLSIAPYYKYPNEYLRASNRGLLRQFIKRLRSFSSTFSGDAGAVLKGHRSLFDQSAVAAYIQFLTGPGYDFAALDDETLEKISQLLLHVHHIVISVAHLRSKHGYLFTCNQETSDLII